MRPTIDPEPGTERLPSRPVPTPPPDPVGRVFYGWWITGASFLILFVVVGVGLYAPPVFLVPLQEHFGWSRAAITFGQSIAALVAGLASPFVGTAIDRFGPRRIMLVGSVLMGSGFLLFGAMGSIWHLYALNALASFGLACVAWIPNQALIASWFERRRGVAMGVSVAGIGFGGLAMAPLAGLLISGAGWRAAFAVLGGLVLVVVSTIILALVRDRPEDLGLLPDGATPEGGAAPADVPVPGLELGQAARTRAFAFLAALYFLTVFGSLSVVNHLVAFLRDQGFAATRAPLALGFVVGASVIGRVLFGSLADRLPKHATMSAAFLLHAASILLLFRIHDPGALSAFVVLFGVALGGGAVMVPLIVGECFGMRAFGSVLGLVMIPATLGAAVGPVLTGWIFDVRGSYSLAFGLHVAALALAGLLALFVRPPPHGRSPHPIPSGS